MKKLRANEFYRKLEVWNMSQKRKNNNEYKENEKQSARFRYHNRYKIDMSFKMRRSKSQKKYRDANKQKKSAYNKEWYKKNREREIERKKLYRLNMKFNKIKDSTYKERMKRYVKKQKEELGDWYIKRLLTRHKKIEITAEMIEAKRQEVLKMRKDGNWRTKKRLKASQEEM